MGQAKKRKEQVPDTSLKGRRKATALGIGNTATASLARVAAEAAVVQERKQYHENKEKSKQAKAKKKYDKSYMHDYWEDHRQENESKKRYGSSAAGVTYKHHAQVGKLNKKGRKF